jgi:hypothetical protein
VRVRPQGGLKPRPQRVGDQAAQEALRRAGRQARRLAALVMPAVARHCGQVCLPA